MRYLYGVVATVVVLLVSVAMLAQTWPADVSIGPRLNDGSIERTISIDVPEGYRGLRFRAAVDSTLRVNPSEGTLQAIQRFAITGVPQTRRSFLTLAFDRRGIEPVKISMVVDGWFPTAGGGRGGAPAGGGAGAAPKPAGPPPAGPPVTPPPPSPSPAPSPSPSPAPPAPPPPPVPRDPQWNAWVEKGTGDNVTWTPVPRLETTTSYAVVLELALAQYVNVSGGTSSAPLGKVLGDIIGQLPSSETELQLDALLLADARYITASATLHPFSIDVGRLRAATGSASRPNRVTFDQLRSMQFADLQLGRVTLPFRSAGINGATSLAVSIWHRGVPVAEVVVGPLCVSRNTQSPCTAKSAPIASLTGLDSGLSPATHRDRLGSPLGSLQLIQVEPHRTYGVLTRSGSSSYTTWSLDQSLDEIATLIRTSVNQTIERAIKEKDPAWLVEGGRAIFNTLLLGTQLSQGASSSDVLTSIRDAADQASAPGALYVRAVSDGRSPLFGLPLALAYLESRTDGASDFLGFHLRVEMPLEGVGYEQTTECIRKWVFLAPPADDARIDEALKAARKQIESWVSRLKANASAATVYESMADLAAWLRAQGDADIENTAIVIVSHHDGGRLYLLPSGPLPASNIRRELLRPAAVILGACGTAGLGSTDVLRRFAQAGANAIVGTSMEVDGGMAGKFISLLMDDLAANAGDDTYSLGRAIFATTKQLRSETFDGTTQYGAFALLFGLAGDAGLQLCVPR